MCRKPLLYVRPSAALTIYVSARPSYICLRSPYLEHMCRKALLPIIYVSAQGHAMYVSEAPRIYACSYEHMALLCDDPQRSCAMTRRYVSAYYYMCVLILLYTTMCPYTTLLCDDPQVCVRILLYYYMCVLILLYTTMCPYTTLLCDDPQVCVRILLYYYICVLIRLYTTMCPYTTLLCDDPQVCVRILLCVCPYTTIHYSVSLYYALV
jgi:hypothetical protein